MSYLESFADKPAIVIDIGNAYTKCGFAGETAPLAIIPSRVSRNLSTSSSVNIFDYKHLTESNTQDLEMLKEMLIQFLYKIYYKLLISNSRERKVVIIESILTPSEFRNSLADVLFNNFQAISVLFISSHLASLYTLGVNTALVLDCGYNDCQIMPIAEGMPLTGLCDFVNLGAKSLHIHLLELIQKHAQVTIGNKKIPFADLETKPELSEEILEDIKLKCCFVTSFERAQQFYSLIEAKNLKFDDFTEVDFKFAPDCDYNLQDNLILHIPGYIRETAFEILYVNRIDPGQTIPSLILDTLLKCPIDLKKDFASNVFLIGGTCMLSGFKDRLVNEINSLLSDESYSKTFAFKKLSYLVPPSHDNYSAWLGGAIFGSLEVMDFYSIPNAKFKETQKLPDWFTINGKLEAVQI